MTTYLAVQPNPPRAELRELIEVCHAANRLLPPAEPEDAGEGWDLS
jgi:hypothetical protein